MLDAWGGRYYGRLVAVDHPSSMPRHSLQQQAPQRPKEVFVAVAYGRNLHAKDWLFTFLRSVGLEPREWEQGIAALRNGAPQVIDVVDHIFRCAQAAIILLTPDEEAFLKFPFHDGRSESSPQPQARPNVLFEAGLAFVHQPDRTIFVRLGEHRVISDIVGLHDIRVTANDNQHVELIHRLRTAGCSVQDAGTDWKNAGALELKEALKLANSPSSRSLLRSLLAVQEAYQDLRDGVISFALTNRARGSRASRAVLEMYSVQFSCIQAHDPLMSPGEGWDRTLESALPKLSADCQGRLSKLHSAVCGYHVRHTRLARYGRGKSAAPRDAFSDLAYAARQVVTASTALMKGLLDAEHFG